MVWIPGQLLYLRRSTNEVMDWGAVSAQHAAAPATDTLSSTHKLSQLGTRGIQLLPFAPLSS